MSELPLSIMKRLLKRADNERVSESAAIGLGAILESIGEKIAEEAVRSAKNREVKTVTEKDIRYAVGELKKPVNIW